MGFVGIFSSNVSKDATDRKQEIKEFTNFAESSAGGNYIRPRESRQLQRTRCGASIHTAAQCPQSSVEKVTVLAAKLS